MIPKEMKYNVHNGKLRGDVLPPPRGRNTNCSVVKINVKKIAFGNKEHTTDQKMGVSVKSLPSFTKRTCFRYENTPIQIYYKLFPLKTESFQIKNMIFFHISAQNINWGTR